MNYIKPNQSLSDYSSYQIGGVAHLLAEPENLAELSDCLKMAQKQNLRVFLFGLGANVLFPDNPRLDTLYISLRRFLFFELDKNFIFFSAGIPLSLLAFLGVWSGQPEMAFTYLLPGIIGAGIFMNVKYREGQMSDLIQEVRYLDENQKIQTLPASECEFAYKTSIFQQNNWVILGATFKKSKLDTQGLDFLKNLLETLQDPTLNLAKLSVFYGLFHEWKNKLPESNLLADFDLIENYRNEKHHFDTASCGSVFKNNYDFGTPTGALVEKLGLKGLESGDAQIAPYHGNIILNRGKAKSADVLSLIETVQQRVSLEYGFTPEPEVQIED